MALQTLKYLWLLVVAQVVLDMAVAVELAVLFITAHSQ
jgi:hypothetical protein